MATNETSSVSETVGETPTTAESNADSVKVETNSEARPSSPDPSCPICLDNVTDAAYTDMCCHRFCFTCLVSWSRVKPECPLCKQRFSLIIHNVRSMGDYDELPVTWVDPPPSSLDANFFISVAFQRPRPGWAWRLHDVLAGPSSLSNPSLSSSTLPSSTIPSSTIPSSTIPSSTLPSSTLPNSVSAPITSNPVIIPTRTAPPLFPPSTFTTLRNTVAMEWRRRRQVSSSELRNYIYRLNQWVCPPRPRPGVPYRVRECSPSFYRNNPAQVNRLIPWLHRELLVLLEVSYVTEEICQRILQAITNIPIRSHRFHAMLWPYLHERTAHFIHEFYSFAISPYDMLAYDLRSEYDRRSTDFSEPHPSEPENNSDSSDIEVIETPEPVHELIEISDDSDEVVRVDEGNNSDASVEIISTLPPLMLRDPEVIDLVDDSSDSDVQHTGTINTMNGACESTLEMELPCHPVNLSSYYSPSNLERKDRVGRNKHQAYYKDETSTSEEEEPRRRPIRRKKRKIEPPKKRKRMIEHSSSCDCSDQESQERLQPSSSKDSSHSASEFRETRSRSKLISSSEDKSSGNKSCSSVSTVGSSGRSRFSKRRNTDSSQPSTSNKDKSRLVDSTTSIKTEKNVPDYPPVGSPDFSPNLYPLQNNGQVDNNLDLLQYKWGSHLLDNVSEEDHHRSQGTRSSVSRSPSPKPRLKSVVKKIEPSQEAGCSSWPLHNLRQRKVTKYAYTPYFSTSDSDS